jgi:type II secretory pathway pseudopilin PulG
VIRATPRPRNGATAGFTLAGVIVIMTIMMIFVAYTVPRLWSTVLKRERERETIYAMQQYAKAISEFQDKNKAFPTSIQQLKDARQPRFIRGVKGEFPDPLTGEVDWLVIPQSAAAVIPQHKYAGGTAPNPTGSGAPPPPPPPPPDTSGTDTTGTNAGKPALPGIPIKDYAGGPFIGVRPNAHGKSLLMLFEADTYETWVYTVTDYQQERDIRKLAGATVFH